MIYADIYLFIHSALVIPEWFEKNFMGDMAVCFLPQHHVMSKDALKTVLGTFSEFTSKEKLGKNRKVKC